MSRDYIDPETDRNDSSIESLGEQYKRIDHLPIDGWYNSPAGLYGPFVLLAISLFLPWISVAAPIIGERSLTGFDMASTLIFVFSVPVIAVIYTEWSHRDITRAVVGGLLCLLIVGYGLSLLNDIERMNAVAQNTIFAGTVSASLGLGIYLAIFASAAVAWGGYKSMRSMEN